jgi:hypothetical protein
MGERIFGLIVNAMPWAILAAAYGFVGMIVVQGIAR